VLPTPPEIRDHGKAGAPYASGSVCADGMFSDLCNVREGGEQMFTGYLNTYEMVTRYFKIKTVHSFRELDFTTNFEAMWVPD